MIKKCCRKKCENIATAKITNSDYCDKCYRFHGMRDGSRKAEKYIPTFEELEKLFKNINNMKCPICKIKMIWRSKYDNNKNSKVMSLQHNNNKTISFICCSCNAAHGNHKLGDNFLTIPMHEKYCPSCNKILNINLFCKNKNSHDGCSGQCKSCKRKYTNNFRTKLRIANKCIICYKQNDRNGTKCLNCCEKRKISRRN